MCLLVLHLHNLQRKQFFSFVIKHFINSRDMIDFYIVFIFIRREPNINCLQEWKIAFFDQ